MNTYQNLNDALSAARRDYRGTREPAAMVVLEDNDSFSARFTETDIDATAITYQRGLMGFWGDSARRAYRDNDYAVGVVTGAVLERRTGRG